MDSAKGKKRVTKGRGAGPVKRVLLHAAAELTLLPDSIITCIFSQLDVLSRIRLAQTCKRFWMMHVDQNIWRTADLSTLRAKLDARMLKRVAHAYLGRNLEELTISTKPKADGKPILTVKTFEDIAMKCKHCLTCLKLVSVNLGDIQVSHLGSCKALRHLHLEGCVTSFLWFQKGLDVSFFSQLQTLCILNCPMFSMFDLDALCTLQWHELTSLKLRKLYRLKTEAFAKIFTSMPALKELWVEDFGHCVTQLSDVIGGGRNVSSGFLKSLPHLVSLSLANTLNDLSVKDVEMLASVLPDLRHLDISGYEMSQGLLVATLSHFHHLKVLYCTQVLESVEQQTTLYLPAIHKDCRIVVLPHVQ